MSLAKVIAISGKPGLYEILAQTKGGFITTALLDGKKTPVRNSHNVSLLSDIAIYTYEEEKPLGEVFLAIHEKQEGKEAPSHKESEKVLTAFFSEVLPDYDEDRVYISNIKKVIQWYNVLIKAEFDFETIKNDLEEIRKAQEEAAQ